MSPKLATIPPDNGERYRVVLVNVGGVNKKLVVPPPVAIAPTNIESTSFTANWKRSFAAESYRLDVSESEEFTSFVSGYENRSVSGTNEPVTGLTEDIPYYYRVRAEYLEDTFSNNSNIIGVTTESAPPPEIGDEMEGGKVAYLGNEFPVMGKMICHPEWDYDSNTRQWGCQGTTVGRSNRELGSGYENTETAIAATDCMDSDKAPRICWDTDTAGYTDWFLPSEDELNELYQNKDTLGGFPAVFYWSSRETSFRYARSRGFGNGVHRHDGKSYNLRIRAVRGF